MSDTVHLAGVRACQMPVHGSEEVTAHYDAKTWLGPWAFLCEDCWTKFGTGQLGTGYGQRIVYDD